MQLHFKVLFFVVVLQQLCGYPQRAASQADVHIVNVSLMTFGWPQEDAQLTALNKVVGSAVCPLFSGGNVSSDMSVGFCRAFLRSVALDRLALQAQADTSSFADSLQASRAALAWVEGNTSELLETVTTAVSEALSTKLVVPTQLGGTYIVPCRGTNSTREVLPLCSSSNNCMASIVVEGLQESVTDIFCSYVPTPCGDHVVSGAFSDDTIMINITNVKNALEIVLQFTETVRDLSVHATRVELYSQGRLAQLYAKNENQLYATTIKSIPHCDPTTGLWMFSLIGIVFILLILSRYVWWRGRHTAKKKERRIIIEEEMRAQGVDPSLSNAGNRYSQYVMGDGSEYAQNYFTQGQEQQYYEGYDQGEGEAGGEGEAEAEAEAAPNEYEYTQENNDMKQDVQQQYEGYDQMNTLNGYGDMKEQYSAGQGEEEEYEGYDQGEGGATTSQEVDGYGYTQEDNANEQYEEQEYGGDEQGMYDDAEYAADADEFVDPGDVAIEGDEAAYVEDNENEVNSLGENSVDNQHVSS
ncbi:uncharacterized protein TM35_000232560 [Trypanosoma theileri]|uniref:Golgi/lysosome glycoprotein n=1 Tax=Trypanosoma theileri TaxID=67003 RepID=A0A1X0NRE4_9TRYP|nr:uncharacterized protein TM35_000232560 [Trypanosoma theileri]ORC87285.1 hypothetical protein TM35_000232560 [Trypanosoma theileri]